MCLFCDSITSGPAVLISLNALVSRERVMKCVSAHFVTEQLPVLALFIILGFRPLTGCDTMIPLSGKGKNTC